MSVKLFFRLTDSTRRENQDKLVKPDVKSLDSSVSFPRLQVLIFFVGFLNFLSKRAPAHPPFTFTSSRPVRLGSL